MNSGQQRKDDERIDQIADSVKSLQTEVRDLSRGIGAVELGLSGHHGDFMLLRQTVDNMAKEQTGHCLEEQIFFRKTEERVRKLEDDRLVRDTNQNRTNRWLLILVPPLTIMGAKLFDKLLVLIK